MSEKINIEDIQAGFLEDVKAQSSGLSHRLKLVGFLAAENNSSRTYAEYTGKTCERAGVQFDLREIERLHLEDEILKANSDATVNGIIVYYPIFGSERDGYMRGIVMPEKDVEGLNPLWLHKLYANERYVDVTRTKKAILPCTPLAVLKILDAIGIFDHSKTPPLLGKTVSVFNRSEVVGRPLAFMLANDGAKVYSFDIDGVILSEPEGRAVSVDISRAEALKLSDVVITGVPSKDFPCITANELKAGVTCINFAHVRNFDPSVEDAARFYIPRIGPITIAMCLRNLVRLARFHQ